MEDDFPLTVKMENDSITIEWDDEHPVTKLLNTFSENDFLNLFRSQLGLPEEYSVETFTNRFDALFARVEQGETFIIVHPNGKKVYITPANENHF